MLENMCCGWFLIEITQERFLYSTFTLKDVVKNIPKNCGVVYCWYKK